MIETSFNLPSFPSFFPKYPTAVQHNETPFKPNPFSILPFSLSREKRQKQNQSPQIPHKILSFPFLSFPFLPNLPTSQPITLQLSTKPNPNPTLRSQPLTQPLPPTPRNHISHNPRKKIRRKKKRTARPALPLPLLSPPNPQPTKLASFTIKVFMLLLSLTLTLPNLFNPQSSKPQSVSPSVRRTYLSIYPSIHTSIQAPLKIPISQFKKKTPSLPCPLLSPYRTIPYHNISLRERKKKHTHTHTHTQTYLAQHSIV